MGSLIPEYRDLNFAVPCICLNFFILVSQCILYTSFAWSSPLNGKINKWLPRGAGRTKRVDREGDSLLIANVYVSIIAKCAEGPVMRLLSFEINVLVAHRMGR